MRKLLPTLAGAVLGLLLIGGVAIANAPQGLGPCATEDSDNCYWNAPDMGDGTGQSFVTIDGTTIYEDGTTVTWED